MIDRFKSYIEQESLCSKEDKVLLAISGGIDSMVMLELFIRADYQCSIAHCNFKLRGDESNDDESNEKIYTHLFILSYPPCIIQFYNCPIMYHIIYYNN